MTTERLSHPRPPRPRAPGPRRCEIYGRVGEKSRVRNATRMASHESSESKLHARRRERYILYPATESHNLAFSGKSAMRETEGRPRSKRTCESRLARPAAGPRALSNRTEQQSPACHQFTCADTCATLATNGQEYSIKPPPPPPPRRAHRLTRPARAAAPFRA